MTAAATALLLAALPTPLVEYLQAAQHNNRTLQISRAQLAEQRAAVQSALAGLTPTLTATGGYTRNQYQGVLTLPSFGPGTTAGTITVQPYDQLQGTVSLNVPLVNVGNYEIWLQNRHAEAGAARATSASVLEVQQSVAQSYYQVVAAQGILRAAQRSLRAARDALTISETKKDLGTANQLTVDRARVDVARAEQTVADAERTLGLAQRSLETLTGRAVTGELPPATPDDVPDANGATEAIYVERALKRRPEIGQAFEQVAQAEAQRGQAWTALAPTLTGQAQEHLSNYGGFLGHDGYWTLGVNLAWTVDPVGSPAGVDKAGALVSEQRARLAQAEDTVRDDVHTAWLTVTADRSHVSETAAEVQSAREALELSQEQFKAGTSTSLDLSQAERDAFTAEANSAQAASDLATAVLSLQKASGTPLLEVLP